MTSWRIAGVGDVLGVAGLEFLGKRLADLHVGFAVLAGARGAVEGVVVEGAGHSARDAVRDGDTVDGLLHVLEEGIPGHFHVALEAAGAAAFLELAGGGVAEGLDLGAVGEGDRHGIDGVVAVVGAFPSCRRRRGWS